MVINLAHNFGNNRSKHQVLSYFRLTLDEDARSLGIQDHQCLYQQRHQKSSYADCKWCSNLVPFL